MTSFCFTDTSNRDPNEMVEATIKYDGSFGVTFLWNNEVLVTTKRRMDSEQAIWARQWIKDHCNLTMFQDGYTYLFEIIYQNNTVIVNYLFEGLVLLAITDERGREVPYEKVLHFARDMGFFMVTPRITGPYSEILWYCGGIKSNDEIASPNRPSFASGVLPVNKKRQEGWVIKFSDGSRQKMVYSWWKDAAKLAHFVHPQTVWLLLRHDKIKEVFKNAPNHFHVEIRRMVQAIGGTFEETLHLVERCLKRSRSEDQFMIVKERWEEKSDDKKDDVEFTISIKDDDANKDSLRQLVFELKPYRRVIIERPLIEYQPFKIKTHAFDRKYDPRVNLSPFFDSLKLNFLRLPILDFISPTLPDLEGYEPSDNFRQTWCKGWQNVPMTTHWQVLQRVLQRNDDVSSFLKMPVEIIIMILDLLDHSSLTSLAKVCIYLRRVIKSCRSRLLYKKVEYSKYIEFDVKTWKRNYSTYSFCEYDSDTDVFDSIWSNSP